MGFFHQGGTEYFFQMMVCLDSVLFPVSVEPSPESICSTLCKKVVLFSVFEGGGKKRKVRLIFGKVRSFLLSFLPPLSVISESFCILQAIIAAFII